MEDFADISCLGACFCGGSLAPEQVTETALDRMARHGIRIANHFHDTLDAIGIARHRLHHGEVINRHQVGRLGGMCLSKGTHGPRSSP
ncbi:hypothetical protein GCM10007285_36500 [Stappia taiwanensis]|nr:hypothetical protein GCM10007285_36500 [Stappia taiwanensis]